MLRSFRVANHKSIRAAQELVLLPAYDKSRPVTPVAAIYGANASGKSNLLDAMTWMRQAVLDSFASWLPGRGVPRVPFQLDDHGRSETSRFEVDVVVDGVPHYYGFVVDDESVREEWLHVFPKARRRIVFERSDQVWTFGSTVRGQAEAAGELTRPESLFLSVAARSNVPECRPLFGWFADGLLSTEPGDGALAQVPQAFGDRSPWRESVLGLLKAADLGITDVRLFYSRESQTLARLLRRAENAVNAVRQERARAIQALHAETDPKTRQTRERELEAAERNFSDAEAFLADIVKTAAEGSGEQAQGQLFLYHGKHPNPLSVDQESAGTKTWLNLTLAIATALAGPNVLLLDEADTALHPHLARHLVNLFRNPRTNPLGAQLIFTCHDATMLDEDTLARDEIWFVEKDPAAQTTRLYSLAEFRPRKHENTERRYLAGSYGAVPVLSEFALRRALARGTDPDAA